MKILMRVVTNVILLGIFAAISATNVSAAILSLDPVSASSPVGQTFTVKLTIDTEGEEATSTDAVLTYDDSILQVVSIEEGDNGQNAFFPDFYQNVFPSEMYIVGSVIDSIDKVSGQGVVATITFQGKVAGVATVAFDCTPGKTSDTNISKSDKNSTDIVECARLTPGTYTIGAGSPTATPQPIGSTPIPTATPRPIPTSGSFEVTTAVLGMGVLLLFFAVGSKVFLKV